MYFSGVRILIPHRGLRDGKRRLADVLSPDDRVALNGFMLNRVARAARAVVADVTLVSPDSSLAVIADTLGLRFIRQYGGSGMNHGLTQASADAASDGISTLAVISGDLPVIEPEDIRVLLCEAMRVPAPSVTIAPDASGSGTNALVVRPPGVIPFTFGVGSRMSHEHATTERTLPISVVSRGGLALDVDVPSDLAALQTAHPNWQDARADQPSTLGRTTAGWRASLVGPTS